MSDDDDGYFYFSARVRSNDPYLLEFSEFFDGHRRRPYEFAKALKGNTHLRRLYLHHCKTSLDRESVERVAMALASTQITHLELPLDGFDLEGYFCINSLIDAAARSPTIQHLELCMLEKFGSNNKWWSKNNFSQTVGLSAISDCLLCLQSFELLGEGLYRIPADIDNFSERLQATTTLTRLEFHKIRLHSDEDDDFTLLSQAIAQNSSLTTLCIVECDIQDDDVKTFLNYWPQDSRIHTLAMNYNAINAQSALLLLQAASNHPAMERLFINGNGRIGYDGLAVIAMELPNIVLKELNLESCAYPLLATDNPFWPEAGAVVGLLMAQGMRANTHLIEFDVSDNAFESIAEQIIQEELGFYTMRNKYLPLMLEWQLHPTVWCHVFGKNCRNPSIIFLFLQEQPFLVQET
jgi:hypothetical protein